MWSAVRKLLHPGERQADHPDDLYGNMVAKRVFRKPRKPILIAFNRQLCHLITMKWNELLTIARDTPVFPSSFLLAGRGSATAVRRQLDRWVKSGRLVQLRRGVYAVALPYRAEAPHPFLVANHLRRDRKSVV